MKISLIGDTFKYNGSGIPAYSQHLYEELIKRGVTVEKIEIGIKADKLKLNIPGFRTINRLKFFSFYGKDLYNKNLHVMSPGILPIKLINHIKKKVITVYDFYLLDDEFIKLTLKSYGTIKRQLQLYLLKNLREEYSHIKYYDFILTGNGKVRDRLISEFNVDPNKVEVSYYIIPDKFRPLPKQDKNGKIVIGYINNPGLNKLLKLRKFIDIFKSIKDDRLEFEIYGKSFPFPELIKDDPRIKYLGFLPEEKIVETYNSFDVYLSTSIMEGFGLPIMQAKACKVPVLCYDGDIPDIVKRNTLIWNDANLEEIIKNRSWEKVDVEKAYLDAEECRADKVIPKMIEVYNKVFI